MKTTSLSIRQLQKRKFLLILPLLVIPFLTLLFYSLGGGKGENTTNASPSLGFNLHLPEPSLLTAGSLDKMSYYNQAQTDSVKRAKQIQNDPYYKADSNLTAPDLLSPTIQSSFKPSPVSSANDPAENEAKVYQKINELNQVLAQQPSTQTATYLDHSTETRSKPVSKSTSVGTEDVDRLEQMMQTVSIAGEEDPEMKQINAMLEKILDIQHPDRVQDKLKQVSHQKSDQVFAVASYTDNNPVSLLSTTEQSLKETENQFYSLTQDSPQENTTCAIQVVIAESQVLTSGATVKLRLSSPVYVSGVCIPKDQLLYGIASLNGERLEVTVTSIRYQNRLFPVELSVYDTDGIKGIYVPGALGRDVAKQSTTQMLQGINLSSLDLSLGAQAASAGVEAAKNLIGRKARLIRVTVKAGYQLLLHDQKQEK